MPILLLIRHGSNDFVGKRLAGRLPGVHLNEKGRQQAEALAQALCNAPIKAIYSSPLERAAETAEPLAQALHLPVNLRPGLMEIDFGDWVGKTLGQMHRMKLWKTVQQAPSQARFPHGESFGEAQQRIVAELDAIVAGHEKDDLLACFSHSNSIKLALAHYLGLPLDNFQRLSIDTTSVSVVYLGGEYPPHVAHVNQVAHLALPDGKKPEKKAKKEPK